jgi:hypothetical protein
MSKFTFDTEFHEDGKTIDFISIGMVNMDTGDEYYAVSNEFDTRRVAANDWLMNNVMTSIEHDKFVVADFKGAPLLRDIFVIDKNAKANITIGYDIWDFIRSTNVPQTDDVELWAWYGAYDHVALAQLFGKMIDLPRGMPMWTNDIKTLHKQAGYPAMPKQPDGLHNALDDARFNVVRYNYLVGLINDF